MPETILQVENRSKSFGPKRDDRHTENHRSMYFFRLESKMAISVAPSQNGVYTSFFFKCKRQNGESIELAIVPIS